MAKSARSEILGLFNLFVGIGSALGHLGHFLIWADNVWGRHAYAPAEFSNIIAFYYYASIGLACVLVGSGWLLWIGHPLAVPACFAFSIGTLLLQIVVGALGLVLAPQRPDWIIILTGSVLSVGSYSIFLLGYSFFIFLRSRQGRENVTQGGE